MTNRYGYYLVEVLVALFIFSYCSLALFKYQWQLMKTDHERQSDWYALLLIDNLCERMIAGEEVIDVDIQNAVKSHLLSGEISRTESQLSISWEEQKQTTRISKQITRRFSS